MSSNSDGKILAGRAEGVALACNKVSRAHESHVSSLIESTREFQGRDWVVFVRMPKLTDWNQTMSNHATCPSPVPGTRQIRLASVITSTRAGPSWSSASRSASSSLAASVTRIPLDPHSSA